MVGIGQKRSEGSRAGGRIIGHNIRPRGATALLQKGSRVMGFWVILQDLHPFVPLALGHHLSPLL